METPNTWTARDHAREASNDYYQKNSEIPLNGYAAGSDELMDSYEKVESSQGINDSVFGEMKQDYYSPDQHRLGSTPRGIKSEDSMDGYLTKNNPAYQEDKNK